MSNEKPDSQQWFLRIAEGTVFGPRTIKELVTWAEHGRIVPGNQVSTDRTSWVPAENVPELGMHWLVDVGGGKTVGPFNRTAAENILKSGKAPAGAKIVDAARPTPSDDAPPTAPARTPASRRTETPPPPAADRDARIQELELTLEKQRETVTLARQAAKSQAAIEEERDELRQQMQALREQLESLRVNAEKDARTRERKLESLRQELARVQQKPVVVAPLPPLLADNETDDPVSAMSDPTEALEDLRRAADDARRIAERELETLRARLQQVEQSLTASKQAESSARAAAEHAQAALQARDEQIDAETAAEAARHAEALQEVQAELQEKLNDVRQEAQRERTRAESTEKRVAELASSVGQRETECHKLAADREALQKQLGVAMNAASDATNDSETACANLQRRLDQVQAVNDGLRTQLAAADHDLDAERAANAELLAAANSRDAANQQRIAELEARQTELEARVRDTGTPTEREARLTADLAQARTRLSELQTRVTRAPDPANVQAAPRPIQGEEVVRQFATEELSLLDKALHEERESFNALRRLSTTRQESLQARIQTMQRTLSGELPGDIRARASTRDRLAGVDQTRMQSRMDDLQQTQEKEIRHFEERETELKSRIRILEAEETRLRGQIEEDGMQGGQRQGLLETIRRREQELGLERRSREQEREQLQAGQQALLKRIEELERPVDGADGASPDAGEQVRRHTPFSWLRR